LRSEEVIAMRVLFVDAGNYCRSPAAEAVARKLGAQLAPGAVFGSAGLKDKHVGDAADPRTVAACAARGYDLGAFRCREIAADDFFHCDAIFAMDAENLAALQARRPPASTVLIELLLGDSEVPDPYFGGEDGFATMMDLIEAGVRTRCRELGALGSPAD
jgi:protein-tyrosine phosphatase